MRRISIGLAACLLAAAGLAQTPPRATVVLGAGRAGTWDTRISVTNVDFNPIAITVTTQLDRSACGATPCDDLASATIASHGTFLLSSIPDESVVPQTIYVLSPADQKAPAVSAIAYDAASSCGRTTTLQVLSFEDAFNYGDILFPGVSRGANRYVNLLLTLDPAALGSRSIGVEIDDASGHYLASSSYELAPGGSVMIVDVAGSLGVDSLEGGSLWLSRFFLPNSYDFTKYAATVTMVEPDRVSTVKGTLDPRSTDPQ